MRDTRWPKIDHDWLKHAHLLISLINTNIITSCVHCKQALHCYSEDCLICVVCDFFSDVSCSWVSVVTHCTKTRRPAVSWSGRDFIWAVITTLVGLKELWKYSVTFPVPKTVFEPGTSKIQSTKFSDCDGRYPVYGIRNCLRVVDFGGMFVIITCSWSLRPRARCNIQCTSE